MLTVEVLKLAISALKTQRTIWTSWLDKCHPVWNQRIIEKTNDINNSIKVLESEIEALQFDDNSNVGLVKGMKS